MRSIAKELIEKINKYDVNESNALDREGLHQHLETCEAILKNMNTWHSSIFWHSNRKPCILKRWLESEIKQIKESGLI